MIAARNSGTMDDCAVTVARLDAPLNATILDPHADRCDGVNWSSQGSVEALSARFVGLATHRADDGRDVRPSSRVAVSGPSPARGGGVARIELGRVGKQSPGEVLQSDARWSPAADGGNGSLAANSDGNVARPGGVKSSSPEGDRP